MKTIILAALLASSAVAHTIEGTLVLRGELKGETLVSGTKTKCGVKVNKVKNDLQEDDYGNPAYQVQVKVSLDGKKIELDKDFVLSNLFVRGTRKVVEDLVYESKDGLVMNIDADGRIKSVVVPYKATKVTCAF